MCQAFNEVAWRTEVVSATYGTLDVTSHIRQFICEDRLNTLHAFMPGNAFFGGFDPLPNSVKAFVLVCHFTLPSGEGVEQTNSFFQTKRVLEGQPTTLYYDIAMPRFNPSAVSSQKLTILDASYYTLDVTRIVAGILATQKEWPLVVRATNAQFGIDPAPNVEKQLSITYAYHLPGGVLDHHVQVVEEDDIIAIPLQPSTTNVELIIHAAYWADLDVTHVLRSRISHNQTLQINTSAIYPFDPWPNVLKPLSVMYQYTNGDLQLLICDEGSGVKFISPTRPLRRNFFNPAVQQDDKMNILAVIWGSMHSHPEPLDASQFRWITGNARFPCTNQWFKFDGLPNWPKTCHVFYRYGTTGVIRCIAMREGQECRLSEIP
jgi:hypothetical protein